MPAREGALRVLRAARRAGVRRVVLTSSFAAIGYGHPPRSSPFTEADWTNADAAGLSAYVKSKTLAERAAWDFIAREGGDLELSVVNPVVVFGPVLGPDYSASILLIKRMMDGRRAGRSPALLRRRRRARRRRPAHSRHDRSCRGRPTLSRGGRRLHVDAGYRQRSCGIAWEQPRARCRPGNCLTGWCALAPGSIRWRDRPCRNSASGRTRAARRPGACWAGRRAPTRTRSSRRPRACSASACSGARKS